MKLSTPEARYLELYDGKKLVRLKSERCEIQLNNEKQYAEIDAGGHKIHINYKEDENAISITTLNGNEIKMDDPDDIISIQNASEEDGKAINKMVLDGKNKAITIDSMDNALVIDGKDNRITMESAGSKFTVDGQNNKIALESDDSELAVDGDGNSVILDTATITLSAKQNIIIRAGGKINLDAKEGIFNKSMMIDLDNGSTAGGAVGTGAGKAKNESKNAKLKADSTPPAATRAVGVTAAEQLPERERVRVVEPEPALTTRVDPKKLCPSSSSYNNSDPFGMATRDGERQTTEVKKSSIVDLLDNTAKKIHPEFTGRDLANKIMQESSGKLDAINSKSSAIGLGQRNICWDEEIRCEYFGDARC